MSLLIIAWFSPSEIDRGIPRITRYVAKGKFQIGLRLTNRRGNLFLIFVLTSWRADQFSFKSFPVHIGITKLNPSSEYKFPSSPTQRLSVFYILPQPLNSSGLGDEEGSLLETKLL